MIQQSKYVNTYDASNRLTTVFTSMYNGTILQGYVKDTFGYSGTLAYHNSWKQHQFDGIHGTWWPQYYMSKHITSGKPDTIYHKGWDSIGHAWVPIARDIMGYNSDNNPDTMYNYEWNWTSYSVAPDYTTVYYYDTFTLVGPTQAIALDQRTMTVFPNPTTNDLTFSLPDGSNNHLLTISVFNMNGQMISKESLHSRQQVQMPVSYLAPGMYWISVHDKNNGAVYNQRFMKQ